MPDDFIVSDAGIAKIEKNHSITTTKGVLEVLRNHTLLSILLFPRSFAPYDLKIMGIGIMATAKQPRSVPAH